MITFQKLIQLFVTSFFLSFKFFKIPARASFSRFTGIKKLKNVIQKAFHCYLGYLRNKFENLKPETKLDLKQIFKIRQIDIL
ncbi:hypothetical protein RC62_486 [Flavobacterium aquidurense]|uniref:Uncharacterized protein n=1 Tax=Flavobacterium aquidurense TaxID=362413 RepID=A0A0Q0W899_9FLAO|nr:hypothetical protein RC62_486 [Flavobacterium aquidurense]